MSDVLTPRKAKRIARRLVDWFEQAQRDLPWRRNRSAYTALVSEAMLQQTQVARVIERYVAFVNRFPDIKSLAAATEQDVLAMWQGLGYYRRARNLHAAAQMIVEKFDGEVPREVSELRQLPGVGRYTAGAIASIVFDQPAPIVDANVYRVLARLLAWTEDPRNRSSMERAWVAAAQLVEVAEHPGCLNEAVMELGALVCTPRQPECEHCPLKSCCAAFANGAQHELPPVKRTRTRPVLHHHSVVIVRRTSVLLEQRPQRGLWSNMWQAPTVEHNAMLSARQVASRLTIPMQRLRSHGSFVHQTTHRIVHIHVLTAATRVRSGHWQPIHQLDELPMGNAQRRAIRQAIDPRN